MTGAELAELARTLADGLGPEPDVDDPDSAQDGWYDRYLGAVRTVLEAAGGDSGLIQEAAPERPIDVGRVESWRSILGMAALQAARPVVAQPPRLAVVLPFDAARRRRRPHRERATRRVR